MKRILYILSAIALLASCTEKMEDAIQVEGVQTIEAQLATTKTVNQGVKTTWAKGDRMTVFYTTRSRSLGVSCFTQTVGSSFSGNVKDLGREKNDWYAFYPYSLLNLDPKAVLLDVPSSQTQNGNNSTAHLIGDVDPLYGSARNVRYGDTPNIQMHHALANVKFTVKNTECSPIKVTKIEFTSPSYITGAYTADITSAQPVWNPFILAYKTVVLYVSNGESIAPGQSAEFSANILPGRGKGNYTLKVTAIRNGKYVVSTKTVSSEFQFEAGKTTTANHNFSVNGQVDPTKEYKTYTKVTKLTAGKAYVITTDGQALKNGSGTVGTYSTSGKVSANTITIPAADVNSVEWVTSKSSSQDQGKGEFYLANGSKYIARVTNTNALTLESSASAHSAWSLDAAGNDLSQKNSTGQLTFYITYANGSWTANTQTETNRLVIYEADPSTPTPTPGPTPTPSGTEFLLERSNVHSYLADAGTRYTNSNTSTSVINNYCSNNGDDIPAPVTLSWEGNATKIEISENSTLVKTQTFSSSSTVDIFNLIPGKTYTYKVNNAGNTTGTFRTTGTRRMIKVSDTFNANHARNCRDLGGIKTADGKTLNYGLIFRGSNMDQTTDAEKEILKKEIGIKAHLDLRTQAEAKNYLNLGSEHFLCAKFTGFDDISAKTTSSEEKIAAALKFVMEQVSAGNPVYINCTYGADRTGYICMILESLLGVELKDIQIDYELTSFAKNICYGGGARTRNDSQSKKFISNYIKDNSKAPDNIYEYAVSTWKIAPSLIDSFRKAMLEGYVPPTPGTVTYYRVDEIKDGQEYLIVSDGHALKNAGNGNCTSVAVDGSNDEITITEDASLLWKVKDHGSNVTSSQDVYGRYILSNGSYYLNRIGNNINTLSLGSSLPLSTSDEFKRYVWSYADGKVDNKYYYLYFNGSAFTLSASKSIPTTKTYFYSKTKPVDTGVEYKKVTSITSGKKYIFVDADDAGKVFTGATAGTAATATISGDSIKSSDLEGYEFTITKGEGNKYSIVFNDGKYLTCDYSKSSNGTYYSSTECEFTLEKTVGAEFFFYFYNNNANQYIYYKTASNIFKIGGSGSTIGVHLYERQD